MDAAYPAALGCEAQLNSYCASACRLGGSVFLARYDRSETDESVRWRCYAQETLSTDTQRFVSGTTYCTRDSELQGVLAANTNKEDGIDASGVDEAIAALSVGGEGGAGGKKVNMKAAFKEFEEREIVRLKEENPGLKLSQYKEMVWKAWQKSEENPMNAR